MGTLAGVGASAEESRLARQHIGLTKLTSTTMFCPSFQTILNYPIQKTKTRQWLPGGGEAKPLPCRCGRCCWVELANRILCGMFPLYHQVFYRELLPDARGLRALPEVRDLMAWRALLWWSSGASERWNSPCCAPSRWHHPEASRWRGLGWPCVDLAGCCDRGMPVYFPRASRESRDHGRLRMPGANIFLIAFPFVINLVRRAAQRAQGLR